MDDQADLERELKWRDPDPEDPRGLGFRPRGANIILALTCIIWLCGLAEYLRWFGPVGSRPGDSSILACAVALVFWAFVSDRLARRLWIAAGPRIRAKLRPYGILGPLPAAIMLVAMFGVIVGAVQLARRTHSLQEFLQGGPLEGPHWRVAHVGEGSQVQLIQVGFREAQSRCAGLGPRWRLPREDDRELLNRELQAFAFRKAKFHIRPDDSEKTFRSGGERYFIYDAYGSNIHGRGFNVVLGEAGPAAVLCLEDAT